MPQGGAGKQGGNLMSSGNSKKKMSPKPRFTASKVPKKTAGDHNALEDGGTAHTVVRPSKETRALVMRAQRAMLVAERKATAARGGKRNGQRLGADGEVIEDIRAARLRYLEQRATAAKAEVARPERACATGASAASASTTLDVEALARRRSYEDAHCGDAITEEVLLMLDLLGERLRSRAAVEPPHQTLSTVLRNAAANGDAAAGDAKYRTLRAQNDKLWSRLLRHEEICAVLGAAGFERQQLPRAMARADGPGAATNEPACVAAVDCVTSSEVGGLVPSFIESDFTTKAEYEAWVHSGAAALSAADSGPSVTTSTTNDGCAAPAGGAQETGALRSETPVQREAEREAEMHAVHVALAEELDGDTPPEPDVIESLLSQLQELSVAAGAAAAGGVAVDIPAAADDIDEHERRSFELMHPGAASAEAMEDLEAVLAAVAAWCVVPSDSGL
eukprot:1140507-Prymnesium_polylepis.1